MLIEGEGVRTASGLMIDKAGVRDRGSAGNPPSIIPYPKSIEPVPGRNATAIAERNKKGVGCVLRTASSENRQPTTDNCFVNHEEHEACEGKTSADPVPSEAEGSTPILADFQPATVFQPQRHGGHRGRKP
jgi:hypothetical protein